MLGPDAALIEGYLNGEQQAVATIDTWIERAAWPFRRRLGSDWDDLLQDARLELMRLLRSGVFRGESQLKTYLWRVVNNACLDRLRASGRRRWVDLDDVGETFEAEGLLVPSRSASHELRDLAVRVLERASSECRKLWMMIMVGLSYAEMSARLEVPEGTLRVRVLRCRKKAAASRAELTGEASPKV